MLGILPDQRSGSGQRAKCNLCLKTDIHATIDKTSAQACKNNEKYRTKLFTRLREFFKQGQAEVVSNSKNTILATWEPFFFAGPCISKKEASFILYQDRMPPVRNKIEAAYA